MMAPSAAWSSAESVGAVRIATRDPIIFVTAVQRLLFFHGSVCLKLFWEMKGKEGEEGVPIPPPSPPKKNPLSASMLVFNA